MEHLFNRLLNLDDRRRRFPATLDELAYQVTDTRSKKVINALGVGSKIRNRCLQFTDFFLQHGDSLSVQRPLRRLKLRGLAREVRVCVLVLGLRYARYLLKSFHLKLLIEVEILLKAIYYFRALTVHPVVTIIMGNKAHFFLERGESLQYLAGVSYEIHHFLCRYTILPWDALRTLLATSCGTLFAARENEV